MYPSTINTSVLGIERWGGGTTEVGRRRESPGEGGLDLVRKGERVYEAGQLQCTDPLRTLNSSHYVLPPLRLPPLRLPIR